MAHFRAVTSPAVRAISPIKVYWTAFVGLFFDYYDLYLFVYLEKVIAAEFALSPTASNSLQSSGIAAVGVGALAFGYLADRCGRERMLLAIFGIYILGLAGLSLAWNFESLLTFRIMASLALGAEWGISHAWMSERVTRERRYRYAAYLQFAIMGGLLAALANRFALPAVGWRWLFAASIIPVIILSVWRGRSMLANRAATTDSLLYVGVDSPESPRIETAMFLRCLALASLTIASGFVNVFFVKELPQSPVYTVMFWANIVPGMLAGSALIRAWGVRRALIVYAVLLIALSLAAWGHVLAGGKLAFALILPLLNGIPFGLMGAYFNEVFRRHRTMLSGAAYNLGRIAAGFSPFIITSLGLNEGGNYFLFSSALGIGVLAVCWSIPDRIGEISERSSRSKPPA